MPSRSRTVLGLVWALFRVSQVPVLEYFSKGVVNTIRGIPILVQLFYIYFVLPEFGIELTALQAGVIGLGIAYSAYQAENFRAGIEAVDPGQVEAALSRSGCPGASSFGESFFLRPSASRSRPTGTR